DGAVAPDTELDGGARPVAPVGAHGALDAVEHLDRAADLPGEEARQGLELGEGLAAEASPDVLHDYPDAAEGETEGVGQLLPELVGVSRVGPHGDFARGDARHRAVRLEGVMEDPR